MTHDDADTTAAGHPSPAFADLTGKTAVVTGASSGIGRAAALELAAAGADVVVHYAKSGAAAESVAESVRAFGRNSWAIAADFFDPTSIETFVREVSETAGECELWFLNAGVDLLTTELKSASYADKLDALNAIDVRGGMLLAKAVCDQRRDRGASIVTVGWDQAERGMDGDSGELFAAAKNAVMGFSRSLAVSYAPNVRVNCVAPGWIRTAWGETASKEWQDRVIRETPLGRWGEPEDIARLVRFLLSDSASYITGQVINANGGAER